MRKKMLSLALALVMCLGLTVPVSAAGTQKVLVDETHGVKITLNGFLREVTHPYNHNVWYDEDTGELSGVTIEHTIYVVANNSTVTIEALEGRKYADPSFVEALKDYNRYEGFHSTNSPEYEAYRAFFSENMGQYAYESTYNYDWDPDNRCFVDFGGYAWPLEKAVTETVSPTGNRYFSLYAGYEFSWLCESDYGKLVSAALQTSSWAQTEVKKAYDANIMPFSPYLVDCARDMTRDEFAATTVRLYAAMTGKNYWELDVDTEHPFTDVDWETTSYEDEVGMAYNLGFVQGKGDSLFKPKDTLSRQEAAVMLARVYSKVHGDIPKVSNTAFADDGDVASWAKSEVVFMAGKEIVKGVGENRFAPTKTLSIQEAVIMANRMLEKLK